MKADHGYPDIRAPYRIALIHSSSLPADRREDAAMPSHGEDCWPLHATLLLVIGLSSLLWVGLFVLAQALL